MDLKRLSSYTSPNSVNMGEFDRQNPAFMLLLRNRSTRSSTAALANPRQAGLTLAYVSLETTVDWKTDWRLPSLIPCDLRTRRAYSAWPDDVMIAWDVLLHWKVAGNNNAQYLHAWDSGNVGQFGNYDSTAGSFAWSPRTPFLEMSLCSAEDCWPLPSFGRSSFPVICSSRSKLVWLGSSRQQIWRVDSLEWLDASLRPRLKIELSRYRIPVRCWLRFFRNPDLCPPNTVWWEWHSRKSTIQLYALSGILSRAVFSVTDACRTVSKALYIGRSRHIR